MRILLVDDEAPSRAYMRGLVDWEKHGFFLVAEAQNVDEALEHLATKAIDLVLMDVYMPGRTGVDLSREIAHRYNHIVMIAISSYDNYDYVREILINGAHDYLLKHRLDSESLLCLLQTAQQKLMPPVAPSSRQRNLQERASDWLLEGGICPFASTEGRLAVTVARLANDGHPQNVALGKDDSFHQALRMGVEQILEASITPGEQKSTAFYCPPHHFVICTQFAFTVSEAKLQNALNINNLRASNSIRLLYKMDIHFALCPLSTPPAQLPARVQELLTQRWDIQPDALGGLTIAAKKQLLTAFEQHNSLQAQQVLQELFALEKTANSFFVGQLLRELTELLEHAVQEYGVEMPYPTACQQQLLLAPSRQNLPQLYELLSSQFTQVIEAAALLTGYSENISNANRFIKQYYGSSISLHSIAKTIGVSSSYLSRLYRQETGVTFIEYLTRTRVEAAKEHIAKGATLKEAAFVCGFSSYNYFFKVFKDSEGITPKEYAHQMGNR